MKGKIEAAANMIVIVFAVVVGSVFLKDRLSPPAPEPEAVKAGDELPNLEHFHSCCILYPQWRKNACAF